MMNPKIIYKKTIKVDFRDFWPCFSKKDNFFIDLLKKDYNVIIDEKNPKFVFFSVFENIELKRKKGIMNFIRRIYLSLRFKSKKYFYNLLSIPIPLPYRMPYLKGNFIKIFYTGENITPDMNKCDWAFSFMYDEEFKHPRHLRLPLYVYEGYENKLFKKRINFKKVKKEKNKFCNFVYSNNVSFRNKFFKKLSLYKKIDSPGSIMNNLSNNLVAISNDPRNPYKNKLKFLNNYKFTIDFKNMDDVIKRIIQIDNDNKLYERILNEPWLKDNKKNKYMDEKKLKKRMKEIFG